MTENTKPPEEPTPAAAPEGPSDPPKAPEVPEVPEVPAEVPEPTQTEETKEAPKAELPAELKTVHSSPPPRDAPLPQEDDAPKDQREREKLLDDAISFLETGSVRNAPVQEKQEFLQSKGLTAVEAQALIGKVNRKRGKSTRNREAQKPVPPPPQPVLQMQPSPTILTYPEWLAPPPPAGPRPLVSGATLVSSLYLGAATAATVYGANKFVVTPMLDALTAARLDFSGMVKKNLDELTSRLLELAPASYVAGKGLRRPREEDEESEAPTDISDPSELFHVDAQTQTAPSLSGHGDDDDNGGGAMTPDSKLEELTTQMKVLVDSHSDSTDNELTFLLEDLTSYLEGLTYDSAVANNMYPFPGFGDQAGKDKEDPIAKVKQEIRSVKGVLLNTKNFPAGR